MMDGLGCGKREKVLTVTPADNSNSFVYRSLKSARVTREFKCDANKHACKSFVFFLGERVFCVCAAFSVRRRVQRPESAAVSLQIIIPLV